MASSSRNNTSGDEFSVQTIMGEGPLTTAGSTAVKVGRPTEILEYEEATATTTPATETENDDDRDYPTGPKVWMTFASVCIAGLLHGLDIAIVAVAVPSLTDQFKTVNDLGWYGAAYMLSASSFVFLFGKAYTLFSVKKLFMTGLVVFETGSLVCTLAQTSSTFILGRALSGFGGVCFTSGTLKMLRHSFPLKRQALLLAVCNTVGTVGLVSAPALGGALIDRFNWRACFGINIPLGTFCLIFTYLGFHDTIENENIDLPLKTKLVKLDLLSTILVAPTITCLLMALQWGGIRYGWNDPRIIAMFVVSGVLGAAFVYIQYLKGEDALLPPRIVKQRSIIAAMWFNSCCNGILAMVEYYISVYFQGVRGLSAGKSGLLGIPMLAGLMAASISSGIGTNKLGYYYPFMWVTSILAPIGCGLLTTLNLDESVAKPAALLGFIGFATGAGMNAPVLAINTVLPIKDVSIGTAIVGFGGGMGSALWTSASATLFQNRLTDQIEKYSPSTNVTSLEHMGLSDIRTNIGAANLREVLSGYNSAVVQTLYMPMALAIASLLGSAMIERRSMKKKQE